MKINAAFPAKLKFLFNDDLRYKVAKGGRGSGKSWGFARALLIQALSKPMRVGCFREVQKSIKDSVHKLLQDQIENMGLSAQYEVLNTEIRGANGSLFLFSGLSDQTAESIKSFEGLDVAWVEEAKNVTANSWKILIPTIRKPGSQIWISYNPELESDETHQRFAVKNPPRCEVVTMNYHDNPWFTAEMEEERLACLRDYPDEYENIWLGKCLPAVSGAIYFKEIQKAEEEGRITNVPYDPMMKVHAVWDLGWNDAMTVILVQKSASALNIIGYFEDSHKTYAQWSDELKQLRYNWGKMWLPHDGFTKNAQTGRDAHQTLTALGWDVALRNEIVEVPVQEGIRQARQTFQRVYFDKTKAADLLECLKRYRRKISASTLEAGAPVHDEFSHGADAFRYMCLNAEQMKNEEWGGGYGSQLNYAPLGVV